jgi:hypothetical protein
MSIPDKIAAANKINDLLKGIVANGGLRLKYRITVDPPLAEQRDWERPEILVEFVGPDSPLLLERGGELLRSIEFLALEMLRLFRLHEPSRHASGRTAPGRRRGRGQSAQDQNALRVCTHVIARAAHRPPGTARSK